MSVRHDDLSDERLDRKLAYEWSWENAQRQLADAELRAFLESQIERINSSSTLPMTGAEFFAMTEFTDPE